MKINEKQGKSMTFQKAGQFGTNSNDTATEIVYVDQVLTEAAKEQGFQFIDKATSARFRILPQMQDGIELLPVDPDGEPAPYKKKGNTKDTFYDYKDMLGFFQLRCNLMSAYKDRCVTTICTNTRPPEGEKKISGGAPANVIMDKVKWKAREQWYRNKQGVPFDETVPKHWISWVGLNPSKSECQCANADKPDMRSFPFPSTQFLVQTIFWEKDGEPLSGKFDEAGNAIPTEKVIYKIPKSGWSAFEKDICTKKVTANPLDFKNCKLGDDFISIAGGHILNTTKPEDTRYEVSIDYNSGVYPLTVEYVDAQWKEWGEIVNLMTYEENIAVLGKAIGEETVGYGLLGSSYEKYCPEEWLEKGRAINDSMRKEAIEALAAERAGRPIQTPVVGQASATQFQSAPPVTTVPTVQQQAPINTAPVAGLPPQAPVAGLPGIAPVVGGAQPPAATVPPAGLPPITQATAPAPAAGLPSLPGLPTPDTTDAPPPMQTAAEMQTQSDGEVVDTTLDQDEDAMQASLNMFKQAQQQ